MLGEGSCDIAAVIAAVRQAPHFNGWVVVEEESETAAYDPAAAVRANLETLRRLGIGRVNPDPGACADAPRDQQKS
jgi:sugar phosphate isomerase/epimerase